MAQFEAASGLAGDIRASTTDDQFDLGGFTEQRTRDLITAAFGSPLDAPSTMVRFTFVVGGGKLVRSRYSEDLPKWITSALRDIGYTEDRSAACTLDCQGTYKQQHDTGQNLKTVIVFPKLNLQAHRNSSENDTKSENQPVRTPEYLSVACELSTLQTIVGSKTPSWHQKKKLLKIIQDAAEEYKNLEKKLIRGELLNPNEQAIYDSNSGQDEEKIRWLQSEIKRMVDAGQLTLKEKDELIQSLKANITTLDEDIAKATAESKPKLVEKLEEKKSQIVSRLNMVTNIVPIQYRLKNEEEICKYRVKLLELEALEEKGRSISLTLADLKLLEGKSDIIASIAQLENNSKSWFQDETEFSEMCAAVAKAAKGKYVARVKALEKKKATASKQASSGNQSRYGGGGVGASSWSTVAKKKTPSSSSSGTKSSNGASSGFASAFGDDSDDD